MILQVSNTITIPVCPDNVQDYATWRDQMKMISDVATQKTFEEFESSGVLLKKVTSVSNLTETNMKSMFSDYQKKRKKVRNNAAQKIIIYVITCFYLGKIYD